MKTIAERVAGLESQDGFLALHHDLQEGKLFLEIGQLGVELLYRCNVASGLGTTEIMLDRGQMESYCLCRFERVGNRVLLLQQNLDYRFEGPEAASRRSVEDSFASRILCSLPLEAEQHGRVLCDATAWLRNDALQLPRRLTEAKLGKFKVDESRCAFYLPRTRAFPDNTEVEVYVTLHAEEVVPEAMQRFLPDRSSATLREHHSFRRLPPPGYRPRELDPRVGYFSVDFQDFAQAAAEPLERRYLNRWRLEKTEPGAAVSAVLQPVVFHLDRGIPEPYRGAIREGALWWNEAFREAGFEGAVEVRDLPPEADPLDSRYSTILWVHRAERGWSVGWSAGDPRTGEILEANVLLDSHRVRTCHEMWMAFVGAKGLDSGPSEEEFILGRVRLLSAHEVGHALGLAHNFASAAYGRGSVMDYYAPRIGLRGAEPDLGDAYMRSLGTYDRWAIRYGYTPAEAAAEKDLLAGILREGLDAALHLLADREARALHGPDPRAHQYVDGPDAVPELIRLAEVRRVLLARFGLENLREGERHALLQKRFATVYLMHRFVLQSAVKAIGGAYLSYAHRGDGQRAVQPIEPARQRAALDEVLESLKPERLAVPRGLAELLAPEPLFYPASPDAFVSHADPLFDPFEPGRQLARSVLAWLLDPKRCARLAAAHGEEALHLSEVLSAATASIFGPAAPGPEARTLRRVVGRALVDELIRLADAEGAVEEVRSIASGELRRLLDSLSDDKSLERLEDSVERDHALSLVGDLKRFLRRPLHREPKPKETPLPPGSPIGEGPCGCGPDWGP